MAKKPRKKSDRMASKGFPNPIDVHVGNRIRLRRTLLGISQQLLAEKMGITFQQVQKYEKGTNRVSSSRLFDLTRIFDVPIAYIYDEMGTDVSQQSPRQISRAGYARPKLIDIPADPVMKRETLELVRAYYGIRSERVRARLRSLVATIAET